MVRQIQSRNGNCDETHTSTHFSVRIRIHIFFHISNNIFECYGILKISYAIKFYYNRIIEKWWVTAYICYKERENDARRYEASSFYTFEFSNMCDQCVYVWCVHWTNFWHGKCGMRPGNKCTLHTCTCMICKRAKSLRFWFFILLFSLHHRLVGWNFHIVITICAQPLGRYRNCSHS